MGGNDDDDEEEEDDDDDDDDDDDNHSHCSLVWIAVFFETFERVGLKTFDRCVGDEVR